MVYIPWGRKESDTTKLLTLHYLRLDGISFGDC